MHALALALILVAQTSDREAEMFGDPADNKPDSTEQTPPPETQPSTTTTPPPEEAKTPDREDDMFGEGTPTVSDPETVQRGMLSDTSLIADADNALAIGGQLFLRLNGSWREGQSIGEAALTGPSLLDAFADVRPTDRVRGYAQLRFTYDYTVDDGETNAFGQELQSFNIQLAQAWTKFDVGRIAYITAGRQRIRWGTGRFWNPTDFVNQEVRNSIDFFDQRVGVDIVKVHFPFEELGWNLYIIPTFDGIDLANDTGIAARGEFVVGDAEFALSSSVKKDAPLRFGADASAGIWLFDVKGEAVLSRGIGRQLFSGDLDLDNTPPTVPEQVDVDDDDWYFQGVVGAEASFKYTDTDTFSVGAEYFYNSAGYDDAALYPFLFVNGAFTPLYTGRHYAAVYAFAQGPYELDDLSFTVSTLGNLSDLSFLSRFDVQYLLLQYVTVNAFVQGHWGNVGEFKIGLDVDPVPGLLPDGLQLANDFIDVGLAARVNF